MTEAKITLIFKNGTQINLTGYPGDVQNISQSLLKYIKEPKPENRIKEFKLGDDKVITIDYDAIICILVNP